MSKLLPRARCGFSVSGRQSITIPTSRLQLTLMIISPFLLQISFIFAN